MHIPDGYLSPQTYGAAYAVMLPAWALAARRLRGTLTSTQAPQLGLAAAFSFVVMMLNVPWGVTTGHATGAALIAILLGPSAAIIAISVGLAVQALFFGDGGITAYGANCLNIAVIMPLIAAGVFHLFAGKSAPGSSRRLIAAALAGYLSLNVAALATAVMFGIQPLIAHDAAGHSLYSPYGLKIALPAMMLPHLLVFGFVEAAVTALALTYLEGTAGSWQPAFLTAGAQLRPRRWLKLLLLLVLITPLGILLPAWLGAGSAWGEWSAQEVERMLGYLPPGMARLADRWQAPLPDYAFHWQGAGAGWLALTYVLSALIGVALVIALSWGLARLLGRKPTHPLSRTQERFLAFARDTIFAERWAQAPGSLQALDVRVKLLGLLFILITISLLHSLPALALMAAIALTLTLASRARPADFKHPLWWAGASLALLIALPALFSPISPGAPALVISPHLTITWPGLEVAARLVLRVTASVWWVGALLLSSRWDQVLAALRVLRIPALFLLALSMAHRYLFLFVRTGERTLLARRSRTLQPPAAHTERALIGSNVASTFRRSTILATQVHAAMIARGFTGDYRTLEGFRLRARDLAWGAILLVLCLGVWLADKLGRLG